jgi:NADH-quinone oxidoreductase subunit J
LRKGALAYLPIGLLVGLILLVELTLVFGAWIVSPLASAAALAPTPAISQITNTHALGMVIYTNYAYLFQIAGLVLLVAMVGAIVLTLRNRSGVRRQSVSRQTDRRRGDSLEIKNVPTGSGVSS